MLVSIMSQSICVTGDNYCNKARGECFSNSELLLQEAKEASLQLLSSLDVVTALNSFLGFGKHTENQKGKKNMENEEERERLRNDVG